MSLHQRLYSARRTWGFVLLAVIAGAAAILVWYGLGPDTDVSTAPFRLGDLIAPYRPIVRHRPTILFLAASLVSNIGQWNVTTYQGAFWIGEHHLTLQQVGWAALVQGIGGLAGSWLMSTPLPRPWIERPSGLAFARHAPATAAIQQRLSCSHRERPCTVRSRVRACLKNTFSQSKPKLPF